MWGLRVVGGVLEVAGVPVCVVFHDCPGGLLGLSSGLQVLPPRCLGGRCGGI